jgi:hypothetical protein
MPAKTAGSADVIFQNAIQQPTQADAAERANGDAEEKQTEAG